MLDKFNQFMSSPEALALGAGLLSASGPSLQPIGFGQALGAGLLNMQKSKREQLEDEYRKALTQNVMAEIEERKRRAGIGEQIANNLQKRSGMISSMNDPNMVGPQMPPEMQAGLLNNSNQELMGLLAQSNPEAMIGLMAKQNKFGAPIQAMDERGQPAFFQTDEEGNVKRVPNFMPIPKNGTSFEFDPKTGEMSFSQGGWGTGLGKAATNDLQKDIITGQDYLNRLDLIMKDFRPEYLTYGGKAREGVGIFRDKVTGKSGDKEYLSGITKFNTGVEQLFNQYRKEITGAAAALAELDRLKASMLNKDMSAEQFMAAEQQLRGLITSSMDIKQQLLKQGLQPGTKEFGQALDNALFRGGNQAQAPQTSQGIANSGIRKYNAQTGRLE